MEETQKLKINKVQPLNDPDNKIKALVDVVIGGKYVAKGLKVIEGSKGLFVGMPSFKEDGEWVDQFHPITKEGRQELSDLVLESFRERAVA